MQESEGVLCMRVSFRIALAGQVIGVSALYEQTRTFCKNYLTDAPASFEVAVTPADIAFEREKNDREAAVEGHAPGNFSDEYLETLALYRKIVERLLEWDTLLFHGSCILNEPADVFLDLVILTRFTAQTILCVLDNATNLRARFQNP